MNEVEEIAEKMGFTHVTHQIFQHPTYGTMRLNCESFPELAESLIKAGAFHKAKEIRDTLGIKQQS